MDYLIDPMWFYWIHVMDTARTLVAVLFGVSLFAVCILAGCVWGDWCDTDEQAKSCRMWFVFMTVFAALMGLSLIFTPDKNTLIEMQIARYATKQNAEVAIEAIKSATDYVIEAIQSLK